MERCLGHLGLSPLSRTLCLDRGIHSHVTQIPQSLSQTGFYSRSKPIPQSLSHSGFYSRATPIPQSLSHSGFYSRATPIPQSLSQTGFYSRATPIPRHSFFAGIPSNVLQTPLVLSPPGFLALPLGHVSNWKHQSSVALAADSSSLGLNI